MIIIDIAQTLTRQKLLSSTWKYINDGGGVTPFVFKDNGDLFFNNQFYSDYDRYWDFNMGFVNLYNKNRELFVLFLDT